MDYLSGLNNGNKITSRIVCVFVSNMTSRSMPMPMPPAGGMPCRVVPVHPELLCPITRGQGARPQKGDVRCRGCRDDQDHESTRSTDTAS